MIRSCGIADANAAIYVRWSDGENGVITAVQDFSLERVQVMVCTLRGGMAVGFVGLRQALASRLSPVLRKTSLPASIPLGSFRAPR